MSSSSYTTERLQLGSDGKHRLRVWAYMPGSGGVVIANFNSSHVLRLETKAANARRMVACWNFCAGLSTEQIETALKAGLQVQPRDIIAIAQSRRA